MWKTFTVVLCAAAALAAAGGCTRGQSAATEARIKALEQQVTKLLDDNEQLTQELGAATQEKAALETEATSLRAAVAQNPELGSTPDEEFEALRNQNANLVATVQQKDNEIAVMAAKVNRAQGLAMQIKDRYEKLLAAKQAELEQVIKEHQGGGE